MISPMFEDDRPASLPMPRWRSPPRRVSFRSAHLGDDADSSTIPLKKPLNLARSGNHVSEALTERAEDEAEKLLDRIERGPAVVERLRDPLPERELLDQRTQRAEGSSPASREG
jgi:hypothetical protein